MLRIELMYDWMCIMSSRVDAINNNSAFPSICYYFASVMASVIISDSVMASLVTY